MQKHLNCNGRIMEILQPFLKTVQNPEKSEQKDFTSKESIMQLEGEGCFIHNFKCSSQCKDCYKSGAIFGIKKRKEVIGTSIVINRKDKDFFGVFIKK